MGALMGMLTRCWSSSTANAHLVRHVARPLLPDSSRASIPLQDAALVHLDRGLAVGLPSGLSISETPPTFPTSGRSLLRAGLLRRDPATPQPAGSCARLPGSLGAWFPLISIILCGGLMAGLTVITWIRFFVGSPSPADLFGYSRSRSEFANQK